MLVSHLVLALSTLAGATPATADEACRATAGQRAYTLLLQPTGEFLHCRDGELTDTPPVSNERLVLQLPPVDLRDAFHFHLLQPQKAKGAPRQQILGDSSKPFATSKRRSTNLVSSPQSVAGVAEGVDASASAGASEDAKGKRVSQARVPAPIAADDGAALRETEVRRQQYLGVATPAFHAALRALGAELPQNGAGGVERIDAVCARKLRIHRGLSRRDSPALWRPRPRRDAAQVGPIAPGANRCPDQGAPRGQGCALRAAAQGNDRRGAAGRGARSHHHLREAIAASGHLLEQAPLVAKAANQFIRDVTFLQVALSISPAAIEGLRLQLGRFPAAGLFSSPVVYEVQVAREPSKLLDLAETSQADAKASAADDGAESEVVVDRFQPIAQRFFSLELALMYSTGLPDHPALAGRARSSRRWCEFPPRGRGGHPRQPRAAGVPLPRARLGGGAPLSMVIIIPFTLDPLHQLLHRRGIGWTDVGSITVGAHIALTNIPAPGTPTERSSTPRRNPLGSRDPDRSFRRRPVRWGQPGRARDHPPVLGRAAARRARRCVGRRSQQPVAPVRSWRAWIFPLSAVDRSGEVAYFVSLPVDLLLIGGLSIAVLVGLPYFQGGARTAQVAEIGLLLGCFVSWPHVAATSHRLYGRREHVRQYPITAVAALAIALVGMAGSLAWPLLMAPFFVKLYVFWAPYHYSGQTLGISLLYARRAGHRIERLERFLWRRSSMAPSLPTPWPPNRRSTG